MRKMLIGLFLILPNILLAEFYDTAKGPDLKVFPEISIQILDGAKNGCWTNIGEVKRYAEDKLELAGARVTSENNYLWAPSATLEIEVNAVRAKNGNCLGMLYTSIVSKSNQGSYFHIQVFSRLNNIFSGYQNANELALEHVGEALGYWVK